MALKKGDIDFMLNPLGLSRGLREQLQGQDGLSVIENPSDGVRYLEFNVRKAPQDNKAFRQAVDTLIDKEFLTATVLQGVAIPGSVCFQVMATGASSTVPPKSKRNRQG